MKGAVEIWEITNGYEVVCFRSDCDEHSNWIGPSVGGSGTRGEAERIARNHRRELARQHDEDRCDSCGQRLPAPVLKTRSYEGKSL